MSRKFLACAFIAAMTVNAAAAPIHDSGHLGADAALATAIAYHPVAPTDVLESISKDQSRSGPVLRQAAASLLAAAGRFAAFIGSEFVEKGCLANAVYFEARSETLQGQVAVATVILNRVKASRYPSSICGVVYQGASRRNACQFSFACDGKSDIPRPGRALERALEVAAEVLSAQCPWEDELQTLANATHYHADYVAPRWSRTLNRLTKIGRHIFYSEG